MANPFDQFDASANGPMMGPPPKVDPYKARDQELQEQAAQRAVEDQQFQREKFEREMAKAPGGKDGEAGVAQSKAGGFYGRALRANEAYERLGVGPQSGTLGTVRAVTPDMLEPYIIGPERQQAEANQRAFITSVLRYESGAAIPPEEFESAEKTYFPQPGEDDATVATKARLRAEAINAIRMGAGPAADQFAPQGVAQSAPLNEISAPPQERLAPSNNGMNTVDNPALAGVRGEYLKRLGSGAGPGELIRFLREAGISDPRLLQTAVKQAQFRRQNPNVPIENYDTNALDDMDVPLSGVEQTMNDAAQTGLGAYAMHAGQGVSLNTLDNMAPNQERAEIALNDASQAHPYASMAGDVSGGVMAALTGEAGLARAGMAAGGARAGLADLAYGAGAGAGATDDGSSRLVGAGQGALAAGAGHIAGRALTGGVASAVSPTGGKLADLYASGVRPTIGQRSLAAGDGKGVKGMAGRAVNAAEEGLSSVPIIGSAVSGARNEARDQFQVGAFNLALKDIGDKLPKGMKAGTAPHIYAGKAFDRVYDKARSGLIVRPDGQLMDDVVKLAPQLDSLTEGSRKRFDTIVQNVLLRRVKGEVIDGNSYKQIQSEIGKTIRGIRKNQSGDGELADALEDLQGVLDSAARRHSDPKAVKLLDDADRGYAKFVRIQEAAKARGGDAGTFTPTQFDRQIQKGSRGNRSQEYLKGEALMQDYADQGMSLVDRIPNSGSADRAFTGLVAAGGAGVIEPTSLTLLGALGALYAPGVRKGVAGAMAPRGAKAKALANEVRKRKRIAAAGGATMAAQGTSPDQ